MRTLSFSLSLALLSIAVAAAIPGAQAQDPPALPAVGSPLFQLYVAEKGLEPITPTGDASKKKTITGTAATPGASYWVGVGQYKFEQDVQVVSDGVITVWVTATQQTVVTAFQGRILKGTTVLATGTTGNYADSNGNGARNQVSAATPLRYELGLTMRGQTFKAGDTLALEFIFFGPAYVGTPLEAFILYGSQKNPSGVSFAVAKATGSEKSSVLPLFFGEKTLTTEAPTGTTDKKRVSESAYQGQTLTTAASSGAFSWGKTKVDQAIKFESDSFVTVYLSLDGTAVAWRGLRAQLYFGTVLIDDNDVGIRPTYYQSASAAPAVTAITIGFATLGKELEAGTDVRIDFLTWSTTGQPGSLTFLFGSTNRPAALVLGGGAAAAAAPTTSVLLSTPNTELTGEAGGSAPGQLVLTNPSDAMLNVTLNVASDNEVVFGQQGPYMVGAANSTTVDFKMNLASASPGETYTFTLHALVGDVEVGNLTYNVTVVAAGIPTQEPGSSAAPTSSGAANATAAPKSDAGADTPGFEAVLFGLGIIGALVIARRRRSKPA